MSTDVIEQPKSNQMTSIANKINDGLAAFEERKSELTALKAEAEGLKIESIEDKQSINQVAIIRKKLKNARVAIEKEGKSMRDPLTVISRDISAKEKELIAIIEPTEKELQKQEDWVEAERERIHQEEEAKEQARIQNRIDRLAQYGYKIAYDMLVGIPDERFDAVVENAKEEYEKEEARKAEDERNRLENEAKEKAEREAEDKRLKAERAELEKQRKEQQQKEFELQQELEKVRKEQQELRDQKISHRSNQLSKLGFTWNDKAFGYVYSGYTISSEIANLTDPEWTEMIKSLPAIIERYDAEEKEKKEAKEKAEKERIDRIQKEAAERALREKEDADRRKKVEEAERLALASDKVKFQELLNQIKAIAIPEMKSIRSRKIAAEVGEILNNAQQHIQNTVLKTKQQAA